MDKNYWKKYYESQKAPIEASLFARYVIENHLEKGHTVIELGCGNGRDSFFFADHGIHVIAVDQCDDTIASLVAKNNFPHLRFIQGDFTKLGKREPVHHVYSRFTLHSISEQEENDVIHWAYEHLKNEGKFFIEARGKKNELHKVGEPVPGHPDAYIHEDHYRRFIDIEVLHNKLTEKGFTVILKEEKTGFAPFKDTDHVFMRVIALKK